jgi:Fur family iron response transcriptional regulator
MVSAGSCCVFRDLRERLHAAGLRSTWQRLSLGWLIFAKGHRHLSAEALFDEALRCRLQISHASIYNILRQFADAGLLREVAVNGTRTYFCTNTSPHDHFFIEDEGRLIDISGQLVNASDLPLPPHGMQIVRAEVIVRLRRKETTSKPVR